MPRTQQVLIKCLGVKAKRIFETSQLAVLKGFKAVIKHPPSGLRRHQGDLESARRMQMPPLMQERHRA